MRKIRRRNGQAPRRIDLLFRVLPNSITDQVDMPKLAPDQRAKARRLYVNSSKTIAKIALSIGVSSGTVLRWARDDD